MWGVGCVCVCVGGAQISRCSMTGRATFGPRDLRPRRLGHGVALKNHSFCSERLTPADSAPYLPSEVWTSMAAPSRSHQSIGEGSRLLSLHMIRRPEVISPDGLKHDTHVGQFWKRLFFGHYVQKRFYRLNVFVLKLIFSIGCVII